ncbi:MAG: transketolase, partial [Patescibacteria group bacterium]
AGSGHPTSSLSAVELITALFFGEIFKKGDHFVLSKGHAAPLLYSIFHTAGLISEEELLTLRKFGSNLEGHPTPRNPYIEVATGSLGQGLSIGFGLALGLKKLESDRKVYVLMGDSEFSEGQNYEALQLASFYKCNNLVAILDVNRLGQRGETMLGWNIQEYKKRVEAFNWKVYLIDDGNDLSKVQKIFSQALKNKTSNPTMIIAKTVKGKGISIFENKERWHSKTLDEKQLQEGLKEIGEVDINLEHKVPFSKNLPNKTISPKSEIIVNYSLGQSVPTREGYGDAITALGKYQDIVALDAEVSNSTYSYKFAEENPNSFFEMFIAEQNMISTALGLSKSGFIPFVSTFSVFLTRAFDQIRMAQYSNPNLKLVGSYSGVYTGADGATQMGLEDIAMMRSILKSVVFYASDAVSTAKITEIMAQNDGLFYLRI